MFRKTLLTFVVRAHGKDARNQFTTDGSTPTGLFGFDFNRCVFLLFISVIFNRKCTFCPFSCAFCSDMKGKCHSPEPDPVSYGPYPINRAVDGIQTTAGVSLQTNAELLLNNGIRSGILMHTGEWNQTIGWKPGDVRTSPGNLCFKNPPMSPLFEASL